MYASSQPNRTSHAIASAPAAISATTRRVRATAGSVVQGSQQMSRLDNRAYYDDFAGWYERERHLPYHRMLDDLEVELVERYGAGKDVLEVGCGTGLILDRVAQFARRAQ